MHDQLSWDEGIWIHFFKFLLRPNTFASISSFLKIPRLSWTLANADRATSSTGLPLRIDSTKSFGWYSSFASFPKTWPAFGWFLSQCFLKSHWRRPVQVQPWNVQRIECGRYVSIWRFSSCIRRNVDPQTEHTNDMPEVEAVASSLSSWASGSSWGSSLVSFRSWASGSPWGCDGATDNDSHSALSRVLNRLIGTYIQVGINQTIDAYGEYTSGTPPIDDW